MKYDIATPYTAVYALLRDGEKVAMVLRSGTDWMNGYYGLPSGKVEKGEPFLEAVVRETKEEVCVDIEAADISHALTMHRNSGPDGTLWVDVYFAISKWRGQVVNGEPEKHSEIAWIDINNPPDNVIPSVASALQSIADGKTYSEFGWDD